MNVELYGRVVGSDRPLSFHPTDRPAELELVESEVVPDESVVHSVPDPGGEGRLEVSWGEKIQVLYDGWRFELGTGVIAYQSEAEHRSPFDLVVERVVVPLHQLLRGDAVCAFHGSSVVVDGRAIILIGRSGAGKSTTARLLSDLGSFAADDLSLIDSGRRLLPGAAGVRSHEPVGESPGVPLYEGATKRWYPLESAPPAPAELELVVHLQRSGDWHVREVEGSAKVVRLLENAFDLEHPPTLFAQSRLSAVTEIARNVPLIEVTYPADAGPPAHARPLWDKLSRWWNP